MAGATEPARHAAVDRLRAFVVFLVVVHHSVLAYFPGIPPTEQFVGGPMRWRAFPVLDPDRWALTPLISGFNDTFFMSLLFLLSGLFVSGSFARKGAGRFLRDRALRLGIPFLFAAGLVAPLAYFTSYLQAGGTGGLAGYARAWAALGTWPTGPAWFVLLLLIYDAVGALLLRLAPGWPQRVGRLVEGARERPGRLFWKLAAASLAAYVPLSLAYGPEHWTVLGPLQFQTSRVLHYFVYFAAGVGIGAAGLRRGLLAADGRLARRWGLWTLAMLVVYAAAVVVFVAALRAQGPHPLLRAAGMLGFVLSCATSCFGFLAIFTRFTRRAGALGRSAADNAYGIYLVHYAFVAWCQYALLGVHLPGAAKAALVIATAYLLSWGTTAALRRIPAVARVV